MRTFEVSYWQETGNDCIDYEINIQARSFDHALEVFRSIYPLQKIRQIKELVR